MKHLIDGWNRLPYNPKLKDRARDLRKNMTKAEKKLWYGFLRELSQKKSTDKWISWDNFPLGWGGLRGGLCTRVYRQRPIDNFIVDFYIPEYMLVIELDWDSHYEDGAEEYDGERTEVLEWYWLRVMRFTNDEVMDQFESVCEKIYKRIDSS